MNEQWKELKETIIELRDNDGAGTQQEVCKFLANLMDVLEKQITDGWIPIKTRQMTEKEKEHYISIGWSEDSLDYIYNCLLPDDGQEVLITDSMGNVELDTFCSDDGCYFECNCDADEVIAWMPLPQPYKAESEE